MSLRERTILVTRQKEQAGDMIREIERRGGVAVVVPMIAIGPPASWKECDEAIARIEGYDAVAFTSVNAVEGFLGRMNILGATRETMSAIRTLAVGEKTAAAIASFGARVKVVPEQFSSASLAAALGSFRAGMRVLFPRGNIAKDDLAFRLRERGATVDAVTVYVTEKPSGLVAASFVRRVLGGEFDVVTFASPSAALNFASLFESAELGHIPDCAKIAVIGPSTADAARAAGLPADMLAREATSQGLVQCIDDYYH
jgi:uroporphyrinogen-III synthase